MNSTERTVCIVTHCHVCRFLKSKQYSRDRTGSHTRSHHEHLHVSKRRSYLYSSEEFGGEILFKKSLSILTLLCCHFAQLRLSPSLVHYGGSLSKVPPLLNHTLHFPRENALEHWQMLWENNLRTKKCDVREQAGNYATHFHLLGKNELLTKNNVRDEYLEWNVEQFNALPLEGSRYDSRVSNCGYAYERIIITITVLDWSNLKNCFINKKEFKQI